MSVLFLGSKRGEVMQILKGQVQRRGQEKRVFQFMGISNGVRWSKKNIQIHSLEISLGHIYIINGLECQGESMEYTKYNFYYKLI